MTYFITSSRRADALAIDLSMETCGDGAFAFALMSAGRTADHGTQTHGQR